MKEDIERIKNTTKEYKKYDRQNFIKSNFYGIGCLFCDSEEKYINKRTNSKLSIYKNNLNIETKNGKDTIQINFCPKCGKQLVKELDQYPD